MKKKYSTGFLIGAIVLAVILTFNLTYVIVWHLFSDRINNLTQREAVFNTLPEISTYIDEYYVGEYDRSKLIDGASNGYVDALGDAASYYLSREEAFSRLSPADSNYTGIGIVCSYDKKAGGILILDMYEGSSAQDEGLQVLDCITSVDGVPVTMDNYESTLEMIRGEEGTDVSLTVFRQMTGERFNCIVRRGAAVTATGLENRMLSDDTGYIRLDNFDIGVSGQFRTAYDKLISKGMKKLVIDLRMNPGGYMDEMLAIADMFLSDGECVYKLMDYSEEIEEFMATEDCESIPLALVINQYTSGSAEYFAAALSENKNAAVAGQTSSGTAYAQSSIELSDGSILVLSTAQYLTPRDESLQDKGFTPEIEVSIDIDELYTELTDREADDRQLEAALEALN